MEKMTIKPRYRIRAFMDKTGWNAVDAYKRMNLLCNYGDIPYLDVIKARGFRKFAMKEANRLDLMMSGKFAEEQIDIKLDEEKFYDVFYTKKQKLAIEDMKKGIITFQTLQNYLNIELPEDLLEITDNIVKKLEVRSTQLSEGDVFICVSRKFVQPEIVKRKKPICIIGYPSYEKDFMNLGIPFIPCKRLSSYLLDMSEIWRKRFDLKVVAVTGSVGKTSTTELIGHVVGSAKNMYKIEGNQNTTWQVARFVYNLKEDTEVYVQECSGSFLGQLERTSRVLRPNVFVITNIGNGHIGNFEGNPTLLQYEKLSLDRNASPGAVGVINWDDPRLKKHPYEHAVTSFAMHDENVDYYGTSIQEENGVISFEIIEKSGLRTSVKINACGTHNVYNALAAFAVGVQLGIDRQDIVAALGKYRSQGVRQNLVRYNGQLLYLDCYSVTEDSMKTAMLAMKKVSLPEGGRKIAILADIPALGDQSEEIHRRIGKMTAEVNTSDEVYFYGPEMKYAEEEAKQLGVVCRHTADRHELEMWIQNETTEKDLIVFKASHKMELQRVIDDCFGTEYYLQDELCKNARVSNVNEMEFKFVDEYGCALIKTLNKNVVPSIPNSIEDYDVRIISERVFANATFNTIELPENLKCISNKSFANCRNLEELVIPKSTKYVGVKAFSHCSGLKKIVFQDGIETIDESGFEGCNNLQELVLPSSLRTIGEEAFETGNGMVVKCKPGSYAEQWAKEQGFEIKYTR